MSNFKKIYLPDIQTYYINLAKDVEKSENLERLLAELNFKSVSRFPGIEESPKRVGVAKSHNALLKKLSNEKKPFIVFEDDININNFEPTIEVPLDADAFYLGNSAYGLYSGVGQRQICIDHYEKDVFRVYNMLAAHAILYLNTDYVKFLARATNFNVAIKTNQDKARAETMKYWNIYANASPAFYQNGPHQPVTKINLKNVRSVGSEQAYRK